jgi:preprotein translocase subunit Sec63
LKNYLAHFCIVFSILILVCFIILFGEFYVYRLNLWSSGQEYDIDSIESDIFNCFQEDIEVANVINLSSKSSSSSEEIELHQIQAHVSSESLVSFDFGLFF